MKTHRLLPALTAASLLLCLTSCALDPMLAGGYGPPPPSGWLPGFGSPPSGRFDGGRVTLPPGIADRLRPGSLPPPVAPPVARRPDFTLPTSISPDVLAGLRPLTPPPPTPRGRFDISPDRINPDALRGARPITPPRAPRGRFEIDPGLINPDALRRL